MATKTTWNKYIQTRIKSAKENHNYRSLRQYDMLQPGYLIQGERRLLNLCANDYLGLAADATSLEEGKILAEVLPSGSGASRLVTGNLTIHEELEKILGEWKGTETALVFPSGYQTNTGVITALAGKGDTIFSDKLNHASIIDGCILSGAAFHRYKHNDIEDLKSLLKSKRGKKKLIVTDSVFSMNGDIAPLPELVKLAKRYGALLLIDDAHATGVLGANGAGSLSHYGIEWNENIIVMGTLSKAIGCQGGFICTSKLIRDYLINYCRSAIYSTSLSPWIAAMAHYNISRIRTDKDLLGRLNHAITAMRNALREREIEIDDSPTPIIPVILGESERAMQCATELLDQNIAAVAIRPPTIPEGTARIRISVSAAHDLNDLKNAADALAEYLKQDPE